MSMQGSSRQNKRPFCVTPFVTIGICSPLAEQAAAKTTLLNAFIRQLTDQYPNERIVIIDDTAEIQCTAEASDILNSTDEGGGL